MGQTRPAGAAACWLSAASRAGCDDAQTVAPPAGRRGVNRTTTDSVLSASGSLVKRHE